jgi:hypothetical protein
VGAEEERLQEDLVLRGFACAPADDEKMRRASERKQYAVWYAGASSDVPEVCVFARTPALLGSYKNR